jgi:hypothetical protein
MSEIDDLEQELNASLAELGGESDKPCGCHEKGVAMGENPFADLSGADDPGAELELALGAFTDEGAFDDSALDFAVPTDAPNIGLEEIVALTQQYPGLKITFSN